MYWLPYQSLPSLICILQLLNSVAAKIDITYPVEGITYSAKGPDTVQWTYDRGDPSNITIYLTTYKGGAVINNLRCLTWATADGSVYITMTQQAPVGESWTWMFYDTSAPIDVGRNQIAESAHFFISGSVISTSSSTTSTPAASTSTAMTTTPSSAPGKHGLSAGAAAAIGVVVTIIVMSLFLFLAYYFFRRTRQQKNVVIDSTPSSREDHGKPELDGGSNANSHSSSTWHEVHGDAQGYELPGNSWNYNARS